jgi:hypothetical protein
MYATADLADLIPTEVFEGVNTVVHCAAETAGGKEAHERNTIVATKNLLKYTAKAGVKQFIHNSSLAVVKGDGKSRYIDEDKPLGEELGRGPYVWAKAKSERIAIEKGRELGFDVKVIRPGPLVDLDSFEPPGRLGREVGRWFVAIGGRQDKLSVCQVQTMSELIRFYLGHFDEAPPLLNAIEPDAPTRETLVQRHLTKRPDLRARWIPLMVIKGMNPFLKIAQRLILGSQKPIDAVAAFATEHYDTSLVKKVLKKAREQIA